MYREHLTKNIYMRHCPTNHEKQGYKAMTGKLRDAGLSEVIGFVLILGLLVVVASLYLAYGVPAQGRENEILHMNDVKDQFVSYKIGLDALFNNNRVGTAVSNSFNLGTSGGFTQGSVSFLPFMSPVSSGGTLAINPVGPNQRVSEDETLDISSYSYIMTDTGVHMAEDLPRQIFYVPDHLYINISGIQPGDLTPAGTFSANVSSKSWIAMVNLTPRTVHYNETRLVTCISGFCTIQYNEGNRYIGTDITLSVVKGNIFSMQNSIIYQNISPNRVYSIDLMDETYGLNTLVKPRDTITLVREKSLNTVTATGNATYGFTDMNPYTFTPIPLGFIEYQAQNNYWIRQNYYYQMGGVFLRQDDGNITYKLPPEITFSYDPEHSQILIVNINALSIDPNIPSNHGIVGGNSPVQLKTTLTNITTMPFAPGTANTKNITISINTTDEKAREMWKNYFDYTAKVALIPQSDYEAGITGTTSYITLWGYDNPSNPASDDYDINVIASNATYLTTVHGMGGIVE
jgi:hypothetical protein